MENFPFFNHPRRRQFLKRGTFIFISWVVIANLFFFYEYLLLRNNNVLTSGYDFHSMFVANNLMGIAAGLLGGFYTINLMEKWLRNSPYGKALFNIFIAYTIAAFLITLISVGYLRATELDLGVFDPQLWHELYVFYGTLYFWRNYMLWLVVVITTLIILMVNDKYGPGVFVDFLLGKYFQPKKERRIFMFIDIRSATTIAEKIGEERYFHFLKDFFNDITPAIIFTRGEIYQYVGDEVVVSWKEKKGLYKTNVLRCFFEMKKIIQQRGHYYLSQYYAVPDFKVGIHLGNVMTGEVGVIKREIAFSGDTLNTAARIQAQCNDCDVDILASSDYKNAMPYIPKNIQTKSLGEYELKGKSENIELFTFSLDENQSS
ncbi:MAG: adenylate cyclase [Cytophagaceae bacterium]|nr:adenylate cyclase [Cytophagaceae bacterium]|tara:strand:- start:9779 stop:10900 length:1122 start_codon:yes stop_codon:yes gene_type:complete